MGGVRLLQQAGPLGGLALIFALAFARHLLMRAARPKRWSQPSAESSSPAGPQPANRRQVKHARAYLGDLDQDAGNEDQSSDSAASSDKESPVPPLLNSERTS